MTARFRFVAAAADWASAPAEGLKSSRRGIEAFVTTRTVPPISRALR